MTKPVAWTMNFANIQPSSLYSWGRIEVASPPTNGEDELNLTYEELKAAHKERLIKKKGDVPEQVLKNHNSTLNSYLTFCGKDLRSQVGREFTNDFMTQSQAYGAVIAEHSAKTAADRLSILRAWKQTVDRTGRKSKLENIAGASLFHKELRLAIMMSGDSVNAITSAVQAGSNTIPGWLEGAYPQKTGLPALRRLEKHLGLEPGHLESKLDYFTAPSSQIRAMPDRFSERHRENCRDTYAVPVKRLSDDFKTEWKSLLRYKTAAHVTGLMRSRRGVWRALPGDKVSGTIWRNELCRLSSEEACPTAQRALSTVRRFFGFLAKPAESSSRRSGLGLSSEFPHSLGMLAIPEYLNAYIEFTKARAGNTAHSGHLVDAGFISNLVAPNTGYLRQQPQFFDKVRAHANGRSWEELCDATVQLCFSWQKASKGKKSRDPKVPLQGLLSLKDPLQPVKRAIQGLDEASARQPDGVIAQAVFKRDATLLALAMSNPLRERTLATAKYIAPGEPNSDESNLYQTEDGVWRLRFFKGDMKNDEYKDEDYDAPLPRGLNRRLEEYLEKYRPILTRKNPQCTAIFPNRKGGMHGQLGTRICKAAEKYIPEVSRLRAHAIRHLVATNFLAKNPGQYTFLAELLHDNLETVLRNYAHGKKDNAFKAHEEHLADFFKGI
jgi:hypothetical protein